MKHNYTILPARALGLLPALVIAGSLHAAAPVTVVTDPVENTTDWTRVVTNTSVNNNVYTDRGGLAPTAGENYWIGGNMTGSGTPNRGIYQYFSGKTLEVGTYTATFDIGRLDTEYIPNFVSSLEINLLADTQGAAGSYAYNERLEASAVTITSASTPAAMTWETWTYTFTITEDTKNRAGDSVVGSTLGFLIISAVPNDSGYAFDNLTITYTAPVPEPGMVAALAGLAALGAAVCIRRRRGVRSCPDA
ncbi:anchor protein [Opitutaceae bacterium TAV5]|nr:anchor protein [Opitutaceae bacterium TAV5]